MAIDLCVGDLVCLKFYPRSTQRRPSPLPQQSIILEGVSEYVSGYRAALCSWRDKAGRWHVREFPFEMLKRVERNVDSTAPFRSPRLTALLGRLHTASGNNELCVKLNADAFLQTLPLTKRWKWEPKGNPATKTIGPYMALKRAVDSGVVFWNKRSPVVDGAEPLKSLTELQLAIPRPTKPVEFLFGVRRESTKTLIEIIRRTNW